MLYFYQRCYRRSSDENTYDGLGVSVTVVVLSHAALGSRTAPCAAATQMAEATMNFMMSVGNGLQ